MSMEAKQSREGSLRNPRHIIVLLSLLAIGCAHGRHSGWHARGSGEEWLSDEEMHRKNAVSRPVEHAQGEPIQTGYASWYAGIFSFRKTANGETFNPADMTAAHRTLPFGTWLEVRRVDNGKSVLVRVNDRGPFGYEDRIIDLSKGAAIELGSKGQGLVKVELYIVKGPPS